jgi:hypothetical protein
MLCARSGAAIWAALEVGKRKESATDQAGGSREQGGAGVID